jgi:hypothetical protein
MKGAVGLLAVFAVTISGVAGAVERPSVPAIAASPQSFVGKSIGFRGASCVDDPKGGFLCLVTGGGRTLLVEAGSLGLAGGNLVAERLVDSCKGREKLISPSCRFDIEIEPRSAQSEATMSEFEGRKLTRLYSGGIEMRIAHRR